MRWKRMQCVVALLGTLTLCGCSHLQEWKHNGFKVGPNHQQPVAKVRGQWTELNGSNIISDAHAVDNAAWWNTFGDAEIPQLVNYAFSNNLPLQAAILRVCEQRHQRSIAIGNLYPQGQEAFTEYQRIQFSDNGNPFGIPGLGNSFSLYRAGFNASWEIDLWGRLRRVVESSEANLGVSIEDENDIRLTLAAEVVAAYTEIRVFQNRIQVAMQNAQAQQLLLQIAESKFNNGKTSKLDVSQARASLGTAQATIPPLTDGLKQANNRLCLLLGSTPKDLNATQTFGAIPQSHATIVVGMPRDLLRRRPDIRRAERVVAAQSALIGVAKAELFPTFALKGTINWESFDLANLIESGSNAGAIIPGFRWNILNYGRLKNNVKVQETRLQQTIVNYRHTVLKANSEAENAMSAYTKKLEQIHYIQQAIQNSTEAVELATTQYREGKVGFDRVTDLRTDLIGQMHTLITAQGEATLSLIRLYKTMGGGWTLPHETTQQVAVSSTVLNAS